ncbi:TRAF3-interacting protein 1 [Pectinophora gossypiella]|uniref:TRAF3-interacting protein 1 n=1 Tax=Pectinophora gossypiella TaxID=13191 RepID=UPI00214F5316|nr:TRAF3-interacting protein 1 [Pectinophora gossypiella]
MEKDLSADVIKATQNALGKYVKRPPLTEKLLKKPPFRFLHDIVTTVLKTTGFFEGLFEEDELISENVKDREGKITFLTKVISVVATTTGKTIPAKPTKIVAGQEPEKTNELLQCLAIALDQKLSSDEAVKKYKDGGKAQTDNKAKESTKAVKKTNDAKKLTSKSSEKLTSNKKETRERSLNRPEKEKTIIKPKQKEATGIKKDSPPKKSSVQQSKTLTKKNSIEKAPQTQIESSINRSKKPVAEVIPHDEDVAKNNTNHDTTDQDSGVSLEKPDLTENDKPTKQLASKTEHEEHGKLNSSYTIAEVDLNSSLSSQDLMEVDNEKSEENLDTSNPDSDVNTEIKHNINNITKEHSHQQENNKVIRHETIVQNNDNNSAPHSFTKDSEKVIQNESTPKTTKNENVTRPKSVRPSSSRPGAPRLREKHDNTVTGNENLLVGKVNIIVENTPNEEDEDSSIIIVEQQPDIPLAQDQQELKLSSNQHGALVQQILESQKEFSQIGGKTEIEWQLGAQKAREAVNQEVEQLRFNIQALSRVANPLGKVLDHIQEDVEVMRQELQQWTTTYENASKELVKEKSANEDSLFPLHTKLKQLDVDILEKRDKINDLKIVIHKNSSRIEKLLAGGDVQ